MRENEKREKSDLPDDNNDKIKHVPCTAQISTGWRYEAISDNLHDTLQSEYHQETVFNFFLKFKNIKLMLFN